jgi:hypothetical protein
MPGFFKTYWLYPVRLKSRATLEKVGLFWKKPYFFFKRLKLDNLKKSRAFSKKSPTFSRKSPTFSTKTAYPAVSPSIEKWNNNQ